MFVLRVNKTTGWSFAESFYEFKDEKEMLETARNLAERGVESVAYKPYKKFEKPIPVVVEKDV